MYNTDEYTDMIDNLNEALRADKTAITSLIGTRQNCDPELVDTAFDGLIREDQNDFGGTTFSVSTLALLNMVLDSLGYDRVAAVYQIDPVSGNETLEKFIRVEE